MVAVAVDWRADSRGQARWKAGKISVGNARLLYILSAWNDGCMLTISNSFKGGVVII
jgi:hypothetical protein